MTDNLHYQYTPAVDLQCCRAWSRTRMVTRNWEFELDCYSVSVRGRKGDGSVILSQTLTFRPERREVSDGSLFST